MISKNNSALIIVDMQNGFVSSEGSISKLGINTERTQYVIEPIKKLKDAFYKASAPVIYTKMSMRKDYSDGGILSEVFPPLKNLGHCVEDSWDGAIVDELVPDERDYIIEKNRFSGFYNTKLESILRCLHIENLIFTGVATNICVEATVRDAFYRDFRNFIVKEATASYTEEMENASFINFNFGFAKTLTADEVINNLS